MRTLLPSTTSPVAGTNVRTPPKKSSAGQKKPLSTIGIQPPMAGKKKKVTGAFLDQSIEQLNDVTAVSGINLREEEDQLLSGRKEENRASEATEGLCKKRKKGCFCRKIPFRKNWQKSCVEERMRGLISNMTKLSKQRADIEKLRHQILINSDVQHGILLVNQRVKEEWEREQAEEAEKLCKLNEANKEEDDKMRTIAANVAAQVAVGGDDMLSKWQLMLEQARQKHEIGSDMGSSTSLGKDLSRKPLSASGRVTRDNQDTETRGPSSAVSTTATSAGSGVTVIGTDCDEYFRSKDFSGSS